MGLFRRKQHVNTGELGRLLAKKLQLLMFAKADLHEILVERVG